MSSEEEAEPADGWLVGHEAARRTLRAAWRRHSLPHALILSGPTGIGKRLLARWLVALRWCAAENAPCGACASCRKVAGGQHPDVELVERNPSRDRDPLELGSRTEITVDQVRRGLLPALSLHALEGQGRAALIDDADSMNEAAQNALLKTLEEPPSGCLLLLVCAHEDALLDTVRSRCQAVRLAPLDDAEMARLFPDADAAARALARGRPGRLVELQGLDVAALGALLEATLAGAMNGTAFARAAQDIVAQHGQLIAAKAEQVGKAAKTAGDTRISGDTKSAGSAKSASDGKSGRDAASAEVERSADDGHRLVAELLLAHWRELLARPEPPSADPRAVQDALLELGADLARNIPASVAWVACGLAVAGRIRSPQVVPDTGAAPHG